MRKHTWPIAVIFLLIIAVGSWFFVIYLRQSTNLSKELEERQEWKIAVADANQALVLQPAVCFVLLPLVVWGMAMLRVFRLSWLRTALAVATVILGVFSSFMLWMDRVLKEHNGSYILPPGSVINTLYWAAIWTMLTAALWFGIERIYVARRIAPNA